MSSHVRKAVRVVVVVVQWLSDWDVVTSDGLWLVGSTAEVLENELGVHVGREMPGGEEHGDVAARVHDDVLFASSEPPTFEQRQHLAARLVDVDDAAAIGDAGIVRLSTRFFEGGHVDRSARVVASGHSFPSSPLGFLMEYPSDRLHRREVRALKR